MIARLLGVGALLGVLAAQAGEPTVTLADLRARWTPSQAWLLDRHGAVLQATRLDRDGLRLPWVPLDDVSPAFVQVLIAIEDQRFLRHHGVDWRALAAAA